LKDSNGELDVLLYLLGFLEAYNFGSKASARTQKDDKVLIDSGLLGFIFEKMNGTQKESLPISSLTSTNSCREAVRVAVLEKLNQSTFQISTFNKSKR